MSSSQIVSAVVGATLLFWIVGAYNRLVRLRSEIVRRFGAVDEQGRQRGALLLQLVDALAPVLANGGPRLDALRAACQQLDVAIAHARVRPGAPGAIARLRLADDIVGEARARLTVQRLPGLDLTELTARLVEGDATFAFARRQFNDAVRDYNAAVAQFPTLLLVRLFGFRRAAEF